jgi:uracil-DNA glycosylase
VRAVILGQDPYVKRGQAHGLAFSVPEGIGKPPSLGNVLREWATDLAQPVVPTSGSLEAWARHGVLLLNTALTVRMDQPDSHRGKGWTPFTNAIIRVVAAKPDPVAFLLWGSQAEAKAKLIADRHVIVSAWHPSPKSARGFCGTHPFSKVNAALVARGMPPVDWSLDPTVP